MIPKYLFLSTNVIFLLSTNATVQTTCQAVSPSISLAAVTAAPAAAVICYQAVTAVTMLGVWERINIKITLKSPQVLLQLVIVNYKLAKVMILLNESLLL